MTDFARGGVLARFFSGVCECVFEGRLGLADPPVVDRAEGGLGFTFLAGTSLSGGIGRSRDETNTVRLVFAPR